MAAIRYHLSNIFGDTLPATYGNRVRVALDSAHKILSGSDATRLDALEAADRCTQALAMLIPHLHQHDRRLGLVTAARTMCEIAGERVENQIGDGWLEPRRRALECLRVAATAFSNR